MLNICHFSTASSIFNVFPELHKLAKLNDLISTLFPIFSFMYINWEYNCPHYMETLSCPERVNGIILSLFGLKKPGFYLLYINWLSFNCIYHIPYRFFFSVIKPIKLIAHLFTEGAKKKIMKENYIFHSLDSILSFFRTRWDIIAINWV